MSRFNVPVVGIYNNYDESDESTDQSTDESDSESYEYGFSSVPVPLNSQSVTATPSLYPIAMIPTPSNVNIIPTLQSPPLARPSLTLSITQPPPTTNLVVQPTVSLPSTAPTMVQSPLSSMVQPSVTPMVQSPLSSMVQSSVTPMVQPSVTPMVQSSATPMVQSSVTPMVQSSVTPMVQSSVTPMVQPLVTPMVQPLVTPMVQPLVTPMVQPLVTPMVQPYMFQPSVAPMVQPALPSMNLMVQPSAPSLPSVTQPSLPSVTQPSVPILSAVTKMSNKTIPEADMNLIVTKMVGINIGQNQGVPLAADINDLIVREDTESAEDFEARRRLTLKLAAMQDYKLNNVAAVTVAQMMMKKAKLNIEYETDVESAIEYLMSLLQR